MFHSAWVSVRSRVLKNISWYDLDQTTPLEFARAVRERYGESRIALLPDFLGCRVSTGIQKEHINSGRKLKFLEMKLADFRAYGSEIARTINTLFRIPQNRWSGEFRYRISRHEPHTMRMLLDHSLTLQPGAAIINSGAHVGDTCLVLARHLIDSGRQDIRVYGIDPNQSKLDFVQEVADLNGITNLELRRAALSDHTGVAKEDTASPYPGEWQIVEDVEDANVPMIKLDDVFATLRVGMIHLDVEGFEEKAILGAELIIRNDFPLFMIEKKGDAAKTQRLLEFGYVETWTGENNALLIKSPTHAVAQSIGEARETRRIEPWGSK
ncbi:FkbM family methyltransferase [Gammaproteobacteria bacterium]|nr:FkbM family methyltransferase [Gammaproteobacteria bacterium]